jgi:hypothetical protein
MTNQHQKRMTSGWELKVKSIICKHFAIARGQQTYVEKKKIDHVVSMKVGERICLDVAAVM